MGFFLAHETPQLIQLAFGDVELVEQEGGYRPTVAARLVQPGTHRVLVNVDDASGAAEGIPLG